MNSLGSDIRFAFRSLAKSPGIAITAVVTLAVGIGAVTAMFSSLRVLVITPYSYPRSDQLVHVWSRDGQPLSTPDYFDISDQATSFAELGVYTPQPANLGGDNPQGVTSVSCTPGVLRAFGIRPALGRWFEPRDAEAGAPAVVIISDHLWWQTFAGDPGLVGRAIRVNGAPATVIGIMPPDFEFAAPWMRTASCDMWLPLQLERGKGDRGSHWMCAIGRLKEGVSIQAADGEIKAIGARLKAAYPETNAQKPFLVRSLHFEMTRYVGSRVWMLFGAVVLVLLVACANVASMLLARTARRQGEFGVRIALGASRGRIVRLALVESMVLSLAGAIGGIAVAYAGLYALRAIAPTTELRKAAMVIDGQVLVFAIGVAILTALLAGIPPALASVRIAVADLLRMDSRNATGSAIRHRLLRSLIIAQIAVAFVLANGAALFSASYAKVLAANSNLATTYVLSAQVNFRADRYKDKKARARFCDQLDERIAALPGVTAVGMTTKLPLEGGSNMNILVNDQVFDPTAKRTLAEVSAVTPGYFAAVGLAVLHGRTLQPGDVGDDNIGVVVNRTLAEQCWPNQDPLGKIIRPGSAKAWYHARVVGVVETVRQWGADAEPRPEIYWTPERAWSQTMFINVRAQTPAASLAPALRQAIAQLDPDLPLSRIRTLQTVVDEATEGQRAIAGLVNFFMFVTLGLLAVGLYGTLSYQVLQRTREIGVRMALGAGRHDILRMVFRQGSAWVLIGLVLGIGGALGLATTLHAMVYGMSTVDPTSLGLAAVAVAMAAIFACWLPARRASRVDPIVALRID